MGARGGLVGIAGVVGAGFAADEFLYLVGPIAWLGWQRPFLLLAFLGAPMFAAWL